MSSNAALIIRLVTDMLTLMIDDEKIFHINSNQRWKYSKDTLYLQKQPFTGFLKKTF